MDGNVLPSRQAERMGIVSTLTPVQYLACGSLCQGGAAMLRIYARERSTSSALVAAVSMDCSV